MILSAVEILEEMPDTNVLLVPVGGGSLISGIALWTKTVNPSIRVIEVQSTAAYTMYECFKAKKSSGNSKQPNTSPLAVNRK